MDALVSSKSFFAIQFISALAEEGLLTFDHGDARWSQSGVLTSRRRWLRAELGSPGPSAAAAKLKIAPSTLAHRIKALNINKSRFKFG